MDLTVNLEYSVQATMPNTPPPHVPDPSKATTLWRPLRPAFLPGSSRKPEPCPPQALSSALPGREMSL